MLQRTILYTDFTPLKPASEQRTYSCESIESHLGIDARDVQKNIPELILPEDTCGLRGLHIAPKIVRALHSWKLPPFAGLDWVEGVHADRQEPCVKLRSKDRTSDKYAEKYSYDRAFVHFSIHYSSGELVFDPSSVGISPLGQIQDWGSHRYWQYVQCAYLPGNLVTKPYHASPDPTQGYDAKEDKKVQLWVLGRLIENGLPQNIRIKISTQKSGVRS